MTNLAFFVDGDLEQQFIREMCKGNHIRKVGNGDNFPVHVMIKQILSHTRLLSNRVQKYILLLDLESRQVTCAEFASKISLALQDAGIRESDIHIFVKKREVEDWILADPLAISEYVAGTVNCTGLKGKGGLSRILKSHNLTYHETTTGVALLKKVHCSRAVANSDSIKFFIDNFPVPCWWVRR